MHQNDVAVCSAVYWVLFSLQVNLSPLSFLSFITTDSFIFIERQEESFLPISSMRDLSFLNCLHGCVQLPIALAVFGYESVKLYREDRRRVFLGNTDTVCEATIHWTAGHITFCAACGLLGGCVGGLLGSGGGFILGPLLLEIGVIPQVCIYE